ncbi:MAG: biotin--[acetyl-CoA-carboxylase] ligase [Lachnospiraceae bacterium]|nr:biotin--[acetyl-CoA-carboxylase] ligase [Lachnospiraceae bacterium]MCH4030529.1 biotin--[acetyl-CoA-carboxylase] ligase [Lachnospiraceae bacterium]MCH4069739.1 biotin--[acetyl-CoA-carboxylase] ligase [Lachnospiraceae bacterium]MCH4107323.1 biotin--[acetyl-CoA-carboxylase] ligase [Lachnospiraceae bacterium]MCI1301823.1 biotin--[acetyl-CoA-carboxylase] ligase [Lachnospiraceae bacterium]
MNSKERVLKLLEQTDGKFLSGEFIAGTLGISRTSVWKAIRVLRDEGEEIEAVTNRGYRLADSPGVLSERRLREALDETDDRILFLQKTDSTNREAKVLAMQGAADGTVLVARQQSEGAGHGRHRFWSPEGGIYLSVIRREELDAFTDSRDITRFGACAACQAIQDVCGIFCRIRPVNDLYCGSKKIGGILTETMGDAETGNISWAVIGVGISFCIPRDSFPDELQKRCTSLYPDGKAKSSINLLASGLIRELRKMPPDSDRLKEAYGQRILKKDGSV